MGPYTRQESARTSAVKFIGSIAAWARNGSSYSACSFFAALASPASTSPCFLNAAPGLAAAALSPAEIPAELSDFPGPSSHVMASASRAVFARHQLSATTATPSVICTTCFTPGIAFALAASKVTGLPPITGHWASEA